MSNGIVIIRDEEKAKSFVKAFTKGAVNCERNGFRITFDSKVEKSSVRTLLSLTQLNEGYTPVYEDDLEIIEEFTF